jgi:hypothetical protein
MRKCVVLAGVAALGLAGCSVGEGFVARQWSDEIRQLQIEPVFPPREDFHVGDVYLPAQKYGTDATEQGSRARVPIATWMMSLPLNADGEDGETVQNGLLKDFYGGRVTYPATDFQTPENGNGAKKVADVSVLDCKDVDGTNADGSCNIFTQNEKTKLRRLRVVGFPTFLSTEITRGSLSAFVPAEAFTAALGLEFGDVKSVSVSVPVAESIGLPVRKLIDEFKDQAIGDQCNSGNINPILPQGQRESGSDEAPEHVHMLLVTEVFYTRNIDISIRTEESFGLGANVKPILPDGTAVDGNTNGGTNGGDTNDGGTGEGAQGNQNTGAGSNGADGENPSRQAAQTRIGDLRHAVSDLPTTPGVNLQLLSVADGRVGMRRTFSRPIAIGYRGLSLKIKVTESGCELAAGRTAQDIGPMQSDFSR